MGDFLLRLVPLYALIVLGYVIGRHFSLRGKLLGRIALYFVAPVVVFTSVMQMELTPGRLSLTLFFIVLCSGIGAGVFWFCRSLTSDERGILSFACASGNTGYFGLPMTMVLLGPSYIGMAVLSALGFTIYEATLGYFLASRGRHSVRQSIVRAVRLPIVYSAVGGAILNFSGAPWPAWLDPWMPLFRWGYTVLGMILIGLGLSGLRSWRPNARFLRTVLWTKGVVWPVLVGVVLVLNQTAFGFYGTSECLVIALMALMPLPAISIAVAFELGLEPEITALSVVLSTALSSICLPIVFPWVRWAIEASSG